MQPARNRNLFVQPKKVKNGAISDRLASHVGSVRKKVVLSSSAWLHTVCLPICFATNWSHSLSLLLRSDYGPTPDVPHCPPSRRSPPLPPPVLLDRSHISTDGAPLYLGGHTCTTVCSIHRTVIDGHGAAVAVPTRRPGRKSNVTISETGVSTLFDAAQRAAALGFAASGQIIPLMQASLQAGVLRWVSFQVLFHFVHSHSHRHTTASHHDPPPLPSPVLRCSLVSLQGWTSKSSYATN
jgi:hypothetical protein